jgi:hypothetical protein
VYAAHFPSFDNDEPEIVRHSSYVSWVMGFLPAGRGGGVQRETLEYGLAGAGAGTDVADCASSRDAPTRPATRADAEAARIARLGVARDERFTGDRIILKRGARRETGWSFGARRPNLSLT